MRIFSNRREARTVSETRGRAVGRARSLANGALLDWADTCLFSIGRHLSSYRRDMQEIELSEARLAVETLDVLLDEIARRRLGGPFGT